MWYVQKTIDRNKITGIVQQLHSFINSIAQTHNTTLTVTALLSEHQSISLVQSKSALASTSHYSQCLHEPVYSAAITSPFCLFVHYNLLRVLQLCCPNFDRNRKSRNCVAQILYVSLHVHCTGHCIKTVTNETNILRYNNANLHIQLRHL